MKSQDPKKQIEATALTERVRFALDIHLQEVKHWALPISFINLPRHRNIADIYIDLDYYAPPKSFRTKHEKINQIKANTILVDDNHYLILGSPGAGKTTSLKKFINILLEQKKSPKYKWQFPLVLRLREVQYGHSIIDSLASIIGIASNNDRAQLQNEVVNMLNKYCFLVLIDGLDEIQYTDRTKIEQELSLLTLKVKKSKLIVTSRSGSMTSIMSGLKVVEIKPFDDSQINKFAKLWLGNASEFLLEINKVQIKELTSSPILLTLLLGVYDNFGHLPTQKVSLYQKIIRFMLEEWDLQRRIIRPSKFSNFASDKKCEFLSYLAYNLTIDFKSRIFNYAELEQSYQKSCSAFGLPREEAASVINELESYSGLLVREAADSYSFLHKFIQEYLVANYMVRLGVLPTSDILKMLPAELALSVTLSSDPTAYLFNVLKTRLANNVFDRSFYNYFICRLSFERPLLQRNDYYQQIMAILKNYIDKDNISKINRLFLKDA